MGIKRASTLMVIQTDQSKKWAGEFGDEYTDRNPQNSNEMDALYIKNFGITRTELNKEFLKDIPKDSSILEVGSNNGAQILGIQDLGFNNLTGIEISRYAIEKAKKLTKNIDFLQASALDLPFKDNCFDLVFTAGVLIHINPNDLPKVIDEMYRTSKRYIWGCEYFSESCQEINYRGNQNMLWKTNFLKLFLDRHPDLRLIREKKFRYLDSDNVDIMYLLEKVK